MEINLNKENKCCDKDKDNDNDRDSGKMGEIKLSKILSFTHYSKQLRFRDRLLEWMKVVKSEDFKQCGMPLERILFLLGKWISEKGSISSAGSS